jgi:hypothetical protein
MLTEPRFNAEPAHTGVGGVIITASSAGNTVIVKVAGVPAQVTPFTVENGVIVTVVIPGEAAVKEPILDVVVPEPAKPMAGLLLVQLAPVNVPVTANGPTVAPCKTDTLL